MILTKMNYVFGVLFDIYNWLINLFHLVVPFFYQYYSYSDYDFLTASNLQNRKTFRQKHCKQLQQQKQYLIALYLLVVLSLPSLIISFINRCMKSQPNSCIDYVSLVLTFFLSILTPIVFVFSSEKYQTEFYRIHEQFNRLFPHVDEWWWVTKIPELQRKKQTKINSWLSTLKILLFAYTIDESKAMSANVYWLDY